MTKAQIIQLYLLKTSIKKAIHKYYIITNIEKDTIRRGEVSSHILHVLNLPKNNKNQKMVINELTKLGVRPTILNGTRIYRGMVPRNL